MSPTRASLSLISDGTPISIEYVLARRTSGPRRTNDIERAGSLSSARLESGALGPRGRWAPRPKDLDPAAGAEAAPEGTLHRQGTGPGDRMQRPSAAGLHQFCSIDAGKLNAVGKAAGKRAPRWPTDVTRRLSAEATEVRALRPSLTRRFQRVEITRRPPCDILRLQGFHHAGPTLDALVQRPCEAPY